jgi:hypothetical protein
LPTISMDLVRYDDSRAANPIGRAEGKVV